MDCRADVYSELPVCEGMCLSAHTAMMIYMCMCICVILIVCVCVCVCVCIPVVTKKHSNSSNCIGGNVVVRK